MNQQSKWFERLPGSRAEVLRLFCFPYAGGSAQVYRRWQGQFAPDVVLSLAHLPGRATRIAEPALKQLKPLVHALADAIALQMPPTFAFWGHSMGALISFELARELRRRGQRGPVAIFVSGRGAPQLADPDPPAFNLPEPEFIAELRRLNGTPRELLDHSESKDFFLPTIRADFELVETYVYEPDVPLSCPIHAYGGLQDESVPAENVQAWREQTSGAFKIRMFPGDHFFIHSSSDLLPMLRRDVFNYLPKPAGFRPAPESP